VSIFHFQIQVLLNWPSSSELLPAGPGPKGRTLGDNRSSAQ